MPPTGGVARRATIIANARRDGGNLLVLDAGDSLANDAEPAKSSQGATSVDAMNRMRYDAAALGALDVTLGPDVVRRRADEAKFPFLSVNAYEAGSGKRLVEPYVIRQIGGQRVALVGLTRQVDTDRITVQPPLDALKAILPELRDKSDVILVLSNAGKEIDDKIATTMPEVAVIFAGGDAMPGGQQGPVPCVAPRFLADFAAPGHAGRNVGIATLRLDPRGRLTDQEWQRVNLGPGIVDNQEMLAWLNELGQPE
jgi:2',3'-cyclic-nucleotide 2'-phosphodiesterase (5'-nucleotidase family)